MVGWVPYLTLGCEKSLLRQRLLLLLRLQSVQATEDLELPLLKLFHASAEFPYCTGSCCCSNAVAKVGGCGRMAYGGRRLVNGRGCRGRRRQRWWWTGHPGELLDALLEGL